MAYFPENIAKWLLIDETSLSNGQLNTILTNKACKGREGTIVAMVAGTKAETVFVILEKTPLKLRNSITEITLDMAANMGIIAKKYFSNAVRLMHRFHVKKLALEALEEIRIKNRCQAIDMENDAIGKAKSESKILSNVDSIKQLLARSRYILYKNKSKWTQNQSERARFLFKLFLDIKKTYHIKQS